MPNQTDCQTDPQWAIEAVGLTKTYGSTKVLDEAGLRVAPGSVFSLLGPNGAGKTTMVRILSTLLRPDAGRARVAGFDIIRDRHQVRRSISLTGQYAALDPLLTGAENLRMMARLSGLRGAAAGRRADELLARFGLTGAARRRVATYSGGMRRRLDLAASLVGHPSVIFLDEPTTGLDLPSRQVMWQVIEDLAGSGVTVFLTTQYLEEGDRLAGRVAVLGFRPHASLAAWAAAAGVLLLYVLAISWLAAAFGLVVSSPEAANAFMFVPMIMAYASSAFVPVSTMPPWLHGVAGHQPATPVIETMRGLLLGTHVGASGWQAVAWCGGIFVGSVGLSAAAFRRRTR
jgi:ABC-type Na+ transport system ATPase subunit NatA